MRRFPTAAGTAGALRGGALVAHPTTGLWGIAADPLHKAALAKLDRLKLRAPGRGYIAVAGSAALFDGWYAADAVVSGLLSAEFAGPVTLICAAGPGAPTGTVASDGTVAIRVERHPAVIALAAALGRPLLSTSLNLGGEVPAADPWHLSPALADALVGVYACEPTPAGLASTMVAWRAPWLVCLRRGAVDPQLVAAAAGVSLQRLP